MRFLIIGALVLLTIACSEDSPTSDYGKNPKPNTVATPAPTPKLPAGTFIPEGKLTAAQVAQFYNLGCKTAGKPDGIKAIDPRLRVGNFYSERMMAQDFGKIFILETDTTMTQVTASTSASDSVIKYSNIENIFPGAVTETNCRVVSPTDGTCDGKMISVMTSFKVERMVMPALESVTYEAGRYVLGANVVPAWKETKVIKGTLVNPNLNDPIKPAIKTETRIRLPTVPSQHLDFCGGTEGLTDISVREENGGLVSRLQVQVLEAH
jgi:hypothetical protein